MSIACFQSRNWLRRTAESWILPSCRYKSTTSAIKQGLRATKEAVGEGIRRRDRGRVVDRDTDPRGDVSAFSSTHSTSSRGQRLPELRRELKIKKFTAGGERPGSQDFWDSSKPEYASKVVNASSEGTGGRRRSVRASARASSLNDQSLPTRPSGSGSPGATSRGRFTSDRTTTAFPNPRRNDAEDFEEALPTYGAWSSQTQLGEKKHPELHKFLSQLELLLTERDNSGSNKLSIRKLPAIAQDKAFGLVEKINLRLASGVLNRRYLRKTLNLMSTKLYFWDKAEAEKKNKTGLWFNYEEARLALYVNGNIVDAKTRQRVQSPPKSEKMFSIKPPQISPSTSHKQTSNIIEDEDIPVSIPYTKAASTFLYGANTVLACLRARRRKVYKLYIRSVTHFDSSEASVSTILNLAESAGIPIKSNQNVRLLDKMSDGRPHNGVVLEASVLPAPPVLSLGNVDGAKDDGIPLLLAKQSAEDAEVNDTPNIIPFQGSQGRNPFIVMLDGITDPGNVGSILRTCHFYNVTAVAIATNTCAPLNSAILAKASSGACEAISILALPKPGNFVYDSAKAGWKLYAAVAPEGNSSASHKAAVKRGKTPATPELLSTRRIFETSPLMKDPCILMLGAEGEGLRDGLKRRADCFVSIERPLPEGSDALDVGVDSLNVSAAASVLVEAFTRASAGQLKEGRKEVEEKDNLVDQGV